MKRFNFNNKPMVENPYPPLNTNVLWVDVDESTGKVSSISAFKNGEWKIILLKLTGDMYKIYVVRKKDISNCTYNMVDLGLPSGTLWADRNVGATSPEDYGSYFQWGDTNAYTFDGVGEVTAAQLAKILNPLLSPELGEEITADNVSMILEQMDITGTDLTNISITETGLSLDKVFNWDSYFDTTDGGSTFNKYNNNGGLTVLESSDDAATAHMGTQYRMPTHTETQELINNTTQTRIDLDGNENEYIEPGKLKGIRFTGSNGNSIFIPAAGYCQDSLLYVSNMFVFLWASSLSNLSESSAKGLCFNGAVSANADGGFRNCGHLIRGVQA